MGTYCSKEIPLDIRDDGTFKDIEFLHFFRRMFPDGFPDADRYPPVVFEGTEENAMTALVNARGRMGGTLLDDLKAEVAARAVWVPGHVIAADLSGRPLAMRFPVGRKAGQHECLENETPILVYMPGPLESRFVRTVDANDKSVLDSKCYALAFPNADGTKVVFDTASNKACWDAKVAAGAKEARDMLEGMRMIASAEYRFVDMCQQLHDVAGADLNDTGILLEDRERLAKAVAEYNDDPIYDAACQESMRVFEDVAGHGPKAG